MSIWTLIWQLYLVLCPAHTRLPARNGLMNLFPKSGKDQWDCEIGNYYVALPSQQKFPYLFEQVGHQMFWSLLGYIVAKVYASPRNSTWFTRPFLLVRGWGLGMRPSWMTCALVLFHSPGEEPREKANENLIGPTWDDGRSLSWSLHICSMINC